MNKRWVQAALLASGLLCIALLWRFCAHRAPPPIASLTTLIGAGVSRDEAEHPHAWQPAKLGDELRLGDGARTDGQSAAELTFINGASLSLQANTIVRLLPGAGGGETAFDVQAGEAMLRAGDRGLALRTHVGLATISAHSQIALTRSGDAMQIKVALGTLSFRERDANVVALGAGDSVNVGIGMAMLDLSRAQQKGQEAPEATSALSIEVETGEARLQAPDGKVRNLGPGKHEVQAGSVLRVTPGSAVMIKRGRDGARLRGAGEFVVGVGDALAEARQGGMVLEALDADLEVRVPGGVIIARSGGDGSNAELAIGADQGELKVARGRVSTRLQGREEELSAGDQRSWRFGRAEGPGGGEAGPNYRNMQVRAGDSFVVHTPSAPVAIGFTFEDRCKGEGLLELLGTRQQARAEGSANLAFGPGLRTYTLRCIGANGAPGRIAARGNVQVLIDAGTRNLPPRAPSSDISADGRTYRIYYQNQLPEVLVRWPNAPEQAQYQLELDGKPIALDKPEYVFRSGSLRDGNHTLVFSAQGRRSRTTTVEVDFDNAAPKASLSAPDDRGFAPGDAVSVEGVALPTWKVELEGGTIQMSAGERFSGQVKTSPEHPDIAVRLSHRRLGTHYYLRRASGSP